MVNFKEKEKLIILMVIYIQVNFKMVFDKEKVYINIIMVINIEVVGLMI